LNAYEGMFLFDPASAIEWPNVEAEMNRLMERAQAQIVIMKKWDERRLAYEIRGRKRACYVLVYFRASGDRIAALERDVQLSEHILRCLILRVDHLTSDDEMKKVAEESAASVVAAAERVERSDRYDRSDRYERSDRSDRPFRGHGRSGGPPPDVADDRSTFAGAEADAAPGTEDR
jgi:small subunit ribosomal protein S6